ncbi:MAG: hypothetical protein LKK12_00425 [Bacteroidales bacterium]|nr:hypothetical protein [Bacteroidales bacterium]
MFREIPAVTPDSACKSIMSIIRALSPEKRRELESLSLTDTNYVRALLGAMFECIGENAPSVRKTLNGVTSYKLPISESALPSKSNWNIHEPSRK